MDIKTIFYFADKQSDYESNLNDGNISPRTIVFVLDTGAIYKGGKLFGKMSEEDIKTILAKIYREDPSSFPGYSKITDLEDDLDDLRTNHRELIDGLRDDVDDIHRYDDDEIQNIAASTISTSTWLKNYIENNPSSKVLQIENFGNMANAWATGYIVPLANGSSGMTFSQLLAAHNALSLAVAGINPGIKNTNGTDITTIELLLSTFNAWLDDSDLDTAVAEMRSMWALTLDEDTQNALSWMSASFKTAASRENAFAQVLASASNDAIQTAISGLRTEISTNENGIVSNATASQISNIDNRLSAIETAVEGGVVTTSMISSITDENTGEITAASIIAKVNEGTSSVSISADRLDLSGTTWAINNDGSGFLANHKIDWSTNGGLNINSDSLMVDTVHPWWGGVDAKGNGAICIIGDYTNTPASLKYDSDTQTWTVITVPEAEGYDEKEWTTEAASFTGAAIFDGSGLGITLLNPAGVNVEYYKTLGNHDWDGVNLLNTFVLLQAVLYSDSRIPGHLLRLINSRDGLAISNNVLVGGEIITSSSVYGFGSNNKFGNTSITGNLSVTGNITGNISTEGSISAKYSKSDDTEVDFNGISKTIKVGNYYLTFAKGILIRCETTDPFSGNDPFIDTTEYAANTWDTTVIDTVQASA